MVNASDLRVDIRDVFVNSLPPEIVDKIGLLIHIAEAIGIVFLVYLVFILIRAILRLRDSQRLKNIDKNLQEVNNKLDLLVKKQGRKK